MSYLVLFYLFSFHVICNWSAAVILYCYNQKKNEFKTFPFFKLHSCSKYLRKHYCGLVTLEFFFFHLGSWKWRAGKLLLILVFPMSPTKKLSFVDCLFTLSGSKLKSSVHVKAQIVISTCNTYTKRSVAFSQASRTSRQLSLRIIMFWRKRFWKL